MRNFLLRIQAQFQKYWQALSPVQKITVSVLSVVILVSLVGVTFWTTRPEYSVLYSGLTPQDASLVVDKLKDTKVSYRLTKGGDTISVPHSKVYELRISLAGQGIPQGGGVGFEVFDKSFFGMTEFTQKLNFQRALQGELERTIRQMSGVQGARVHLVLPKKELFIEEEKQHSASVLLKLSPGVKLSKSQIRAIVNLVRTSVEGLEEQNISIIDTQGNILSDVLDEEFQVPGTLQDIFQFKRKIEKDLQAEVRLLLERIVGVGKVAVKANVELDLSRKETTKEEYEPVVGEEEGIVRSSQRKTEYFKGSAGGAAGVPGVQSNVTGVPGYAQAGGGQGSSDYTREEVVTNYEINKELSHISSMPGDVKKISISVILDGEFPPEKIKTIEEVVASGVGIQPQRGDKVVVESFRFDKTYLEEEEEAYKLRESRELRKLIIKSGVIVLVTLIVFLFTLSMIRHARVIRTATKKIEETQGKIPPAPAAGKEEAGKKAEVPKEDIELLRKQVEAIANKNPEKIARAIKGLVAGG